MCLFVNYFHATSAWDAENLNSILIVDMSILSGRVIDGLYNGLLDNEGKNTITHRQWRNFIYKLVQWKIRVFLVKGVPLSVANKK